MNRRKQTIGRTLLAALAVMGSSTAMAQSLDQWVDNVHYEMINGEVVVTGANVPDSADVVLLDEITASDGVSYPVTVIGKESFYMNNGSSNIRSIKGNNITRINERGFCLIPIKEFDFPKLAWIEGSGFSGCYDLKRLDFPSLVGVGHQIQLRKFYEFEYVSFGPMVQDLSEIHIQSDKLMYLACHATTPPKLNLTFLDADHSMPVHLPEEAIGTYYSASGWRDFTNFVPIGKWQLQLQASDNELGTCAGAGNYTPDTEVTIVAIPSQVGQFKKWSDGNTENPRVLTLGQDMKLTAIFERAQKLPQGSPTGKHTAIVKKNGDHYIIDNSNIESIEWHEATTGYEEIR